MNFIAALSFHEASMITQTMLRLKDLGVAAYSMHDGLAAEHLSEYCIADADCESSDTGAEFDEALVLNDLQRMIAQIIQSTEKMRNSYGLS